jgi:hypothetical protein
MTDVDIPPMLSKSQLLESPGSDIDPRSTISRRLILLAMDSAHVLSEYNNHAKATLEVYFRALEKERDRDGH